jgi:hypothetical protein
MSQKKRYTVHFTEVVTEWRVTEIEAESQQEAESLACDISSDPVLWDGRCGECKATVMTEDGAPVEWSYEAWQKDNKNPYRRRAFPSAGTNTTQTSND